MITSEKDMPSKYEEDLILHNIPEE